MEYQVLIFLYLSVGCRISETSSTCKNHVEREYVREVKSLLLTERNATCQNNVFVYGNMFTKSYDAVEIHYVCAAQIRWWGGRYVILTLPEGKEVCTDRWQKNADCYLYTRRKSLRNCSSSSNCTQVTLKRGDSLKISAWKTNFLKFKIWYKLIKSRNKENDCKTDFAGVPNTTNENLPSPTSTVSYPVLDDKTASTKWCTGNRGRRIPYTRWERDGFPYNCLKTRDCPNGLVQETTGRCEETCFEALNNVGGRFSCENKCICPRERYRNENGKCIAIKNCPNYGVDVTTAYSNQQETQTTPNNNNDKNISTEIILAIVATFFLLIILCLVVGFVYWWRKLKRVGRRQSNFQLEITDTTMTPYAETSVATAAYENDVVKGIEIAPPYESSYIEPENLPSNVGTNVKSEHRNQRPSSSSHFHGYEHIQPTQSVDGYLEPIRRPEVVEEAAIYEPTGTGYADDIGYMEIARKN